MQTHTVTILKTTASHGTHIAVGSQPVAILLPRSFQSGECYQDARVCPRSIGVVGVYCPHILIPSAVERQCGHLAAHCSAATSTAL